MKGYIMLGKLIPSTLLASALAVSLGWSSTSQAQTSSPDNWRWFEVEVLVFKQTSQAELQEQFPLPVEPIPTQGALDLIHGVLAPDIDHLLTGLAECDADQATSKPTFELCYEEDEVALIPRPRPTSEQPVHSGSLARSEIVIDGPGGDINKALRPFIQPESNHELTELREQLSRRGQGEPVLHLSYRQPVFTRGQANKMRLFGGENFSSDYDYLGFAKPTLAEQVEAIRANNAQERDEQTGQLARIDRLLELVDSGDARFNIGDDPSQQLLPLRPAHWPAGVSHDVWEFDGLLHIYLVGNYLHVDSEFNLREETMAREATPDMQAQAEQALMDKTTEQPFLRAYQFSQVRRVISHETHYFDHPKLGIVVQIRRTDLSAPR